MRNLSKSVIAFLLSFVFIISAFLPVTAVESRASAGQPAKYSSQYNSGQRDVVCTTLDGTSADDYYTGSYEYDVLDDYSGNTLYNMLQTLMRSTHTYKSTYDDCHYKANRTDCENENGSDNKLLLIYTSYTATQSQWNGWNREHVWPKSLGGDTTTGGGADLHHIRPSDASVNSSRGNKKYGNAPGGTAKYGSNPASGYLGGHYNSTYYEPLDNVKGDVARICLYVHVRWGSDWGASSITSVFQSIDVLLEWCALDPVDTWEMGRNEVIEDIQGNRNVFIDYPELAWLLFNREIPTDMTTPSGNASGNNQGGNQGGNEGGNEGGDTSCTHPTTEVRNATSATCAAAGYTGDTYCTECDTKLSSGSAIAKTEHKNTELRDARPATCSEDGYTGDTYCNDCKQTVSRGTAIEKTGEHSFTEWSKDDENHSHERYCTECNTVEVIDLEAVLSYAENDAQRILILMMLGLGDLISLDRLAQ
jgi:endonuclease I